MVCLQALLDITMRRLKASVQILGAECITSHPSSALRLFSNSASSSIRVALTNKHTFSFSNSSLYAYNTKCASIIVSRVFSSDATADDKGNASKAPPFPSPENTPYMFDGELEKLTPEQQKQKEELIKDLTRRLSGPLADENGNVPTGKDRPTAIEVDGPSHFYANSTRYTAYTKLKHRLLTRMGYKVLHVPYFEWRKMRGAREREQYMRNKLEEEPTEWLDPEDEKFYNERMKALQDAVAKEAEHKKARSEENKEIREDK